MRWNEIVKILLLSLWITSVISAIVYKFNQESIILVFVSMIGLLLESRMKP